MTKERTFIAIKPDGVQRGYVADIIGRFETKGFKLVGLKQLIPSKDLAQNHYGVHKAVSYTHLTLPTTPYV